MGMTMLVAVSAQPTESWAYRHHKSKINYHEYGQEAFDLAKRENKPIFIVLSAVWCFWCKLYEQRTLEKPDVSRFLNRNFINIFVDLDQRQDLQHLYVKKGIPTTVIFTPEGVQFLSFSGTLGEKEFLNGVRQVLTSMRAQARPPEAEQAASVYNVRDFLKPEEALKSGGPSLRTLSRQRHEEFIALALESFDEENGGFGQGKKYPLGRLLQYLLEAGGKAEQTALVVLGRVGRNLYDPAEGGFFRYSDTRDWSRPRYEKMLTTNVNLLRAYQMAMGAGGNGDDKAARNRLNTIYSKSLEFFFQTYATGKDGGLAGSLDGKNPAYYRLSLAKRARTKRPELDETVYTAWNCEAVSVLAEIYRNNPDPRILQRITAVLDFVRNSLFSPRTGLYGFYRPRDGKPTGLGQLKDNSWGALAFITGYALTAKPEYLQAFQDILAYMDKNLYLHQVRAYRMWNVPSKGSFRGEEYISDEVPLEANAILAFSLVKAYIVTKDTKYRSRAETMVRMLGLLEFGDFEDDPSDEGKQFMLGFVYYLRALNELAKLES